MTTEKKRLPHKEENWDGYTVDEVRYLRAYTAARLEINRDRIMRNASAVMESNSSPFGNGSGLLSKLLGTLSYIDIALVTYKLGRGIFRTVRRFRR